MRDKFAGAVCNWILNHVASERYRSNIETLINLGLKVIEGKYMTREEWWEKFGEEVGAEKAEGASARRN